MSWTDGEKRGGIGFRQLLPGEDQPARDLALPEALVGVEAAAVAALDSRIEVRPVSTALDPQADVLGEEDLQAAAEVAREAVLGLHLREIGLDARQPEAAGEEAVHLSGTPLEEDAGMVVADRHVPEHLFGSEEPLVDDELAVLPVGEELDLPVLAQGHVEDQAEEAPFVDPDVEVLVEEVAVGL